MDTSVTFERAADYYDATRGLPAHAEPGVVEAFLAAGSLEPDARLLEIGVGTGRIALPLAPRVGQFVGIDLSMSMMDRLRVKQTDQQVDLVQGDITTLPFPNRTFDAIVAVHIFHLVPDPNRALTEAARVIGRGGRAPLILVGSNRYLMPPDLMDVWNDATSDQDYRKREVLTLKPDARHELFIRNGWRTAGDPIDYPFVLHRSPLDYLETIRQRMWSHMWTMSDAVWARGLAEVEGAIAAHYPDPAQPIAIDADFMVQAYTR